jgi:hypothetical protein
MAEEAKTEIGNREFFIFGNYDYLYFALNNKPTVLPYTFQQPWFLEVPGLQEQIIRSLETRKTPLVLYFPFHRGKLYYDDYLPEKLYNYIMDNYYPVKNLTGYGWILERNSDEM